MKKIVIIVLTLVTMLVFTSCGISAKSNSDTNNEKTFKSSEEEKSDDTKEDKDTENKEAESPLSKAEQLLENMTLEEKVGQLFIVRPDALNPNLTEEQIGDINSSGAISLDVQMKEMMNRYHVGGVAIFSKNVVEPTQLTTFIEDMQQESKVQLFVGVDEEGGIVSRIASSPGFDVPQIGSMEQIGLTGDSENAKNVGLTLGTYLTQYGFNLNFAPVADVNTNPANIVIGNRSFGSDPNLVAEMVIAEIQGLHEAGIMNSVKHFPGHGDTKGDTHYGYVSVEKTWEELKGCELIPFSAAVSANTDMIMIAHITTPNITSDGLPASLSNEIIEERLRKELNYDGIVITDSMSMGAITEEFTSSESAVKAVLAGVDIILMPENFVEAYNGIYEAVNSGVISQQRIDESVLRILFLKEQYGLLK